MNVDLGGFIGLLKILHWVFRYPIGAAGVIIISLADVAKIVGLFLIIYPWDIFPSMEKYAPP